MPYLHLQQYIGEGFCSHRFIKLELISSVVIDGKKNILTINHNEGECFAIRLDKCPEIVDDLKEKGIIPETFDLAQTKLSEESMLKRIANLENDLKK